MSRPLQAMIAVEFAMRVMQRYPAETRAALELEDPHEQMLAYQAIFKEYNEEEKGNE